jgi:GT2 family glycosyltransferase
MVNRITFCIPSKDNLRYLKSSITSIRENSSLDNDIVVYVDADNDGTTKWLDENNVRYIKNDTNIPKGIAYGYNRCIELAETNIVCMFHADMYMGRGFDNAILKHIKPFTVVSGTRIEPPLHPEGHEKIVRNFGMYPEDFMEDEFDSFVKESIKTYKDKITNGIFAPWAIFKEDITSIGMHDERFHSYHEDSDIFNRFLLNGYDLTQTWEGFVYHLTCRGGQFQDGIEKVTTDEAFHRMKTNAANYYIRKWGVWIENDMYHHPILSPKYNIGFIIKNCNLEILRILEPWADTCYVDFNYTDYLYLHKDNTFMDLNDRVKPYDNEKNNEILVEMDGKTINNNDLKIIQQLAKIINDSGEIGRFTLGNLNIEIVQMNEYQNNLINVIK